MKELSKANTDIPGVGVPPVEPTDHKLDPILTIQREFNNVISRYNRHFGGQPRVTRDLRLLEEFIAHLQNLQSRVQALWKGAQMTVQERISQLQTRIDAELALFEG
ncbi:MAG: hypothetical protein F6K28_57355, partial [Microcoleus sp. SIO2G3]|nr:hypothetical protein [Microcoleus sp. SIO2G3]